MTAILTKAQYKTLRGINDETRDEAIELAISAAEDAVLQYTDRDFTTIEEAAARTFAYDYSGILEIDDCVSVSAVTLNGVALTVDVDYFLGPRMGPGSTYYWIDLGDARGSSPEMGFSRNEDVLYREGYPRRSALRRTLVEVSAVFGWPEGGAPASVRQAVVWLVDDMAPGAVGSESGHQAEAIADLSYVNSGDEVREAPPILPPRVLSLLEPFRRLSV